MGECSHCSPSGADFPAHFHRVSLHPDGLLKYRVCFYSRTSLVEKTIQRPLGKPWRDCLVSRPSRLGGYQHGGTYFLSQWWDHFRTGPHMFSGVKGS